MRATWDETWVSVAGDVAGRSACNVRQVGAVIVSADNRDHWVGYNGPPGGFREPSGLLAAGGCGNYCPQGLAASQGAQGPPCVSIHAEVNALMQSDRRLREGGAVYVTAAPCWKCALAIANSGVSRLVCPRWEDGRRQLGREVRDAYRRTPGMTIDHEPWSDR